MVLVLESADFMGQALIAELTVVSLVEQSAFQ